MELIRNIAELFNGWDLTIRIRAEELTKNEEDMVLQGLKTDRPWMALQAIASAAQRNNLAG